MVTALQVTLGNHSKATLGMIGPTSQNLRRTGIVTQASVSRVSTRRKPYCPGLNNPHQTKEVGNEAERNT